MVTLGGLGLIPRAPGTWGSVPSAALGLALLLQGVGGWAFNLTLLLVAAATGALCVLLTPWAEAKYGRSDPREIVLDEAAGQCVALLLAPTVVGDGGWRAVAYVAIVFALFRFFDAVKPTPINRLQNLPADWGVLADDLAAGLAAAIIAQALFRLVG